MRRLTRGELDALYYVSSALRCRPEDLAMEIEFESGWDPKARNPSSSAKGLIQFMNKTARDLGYASSAALVAAHPTAEEQLRGPVLQYLKSFTSLTSLQSLAMAVFYPDARRWPEDREFPMHVQLANPGIRTVKDYLDHVRRRAGSIDLTAEEA